MQRRRHRGLSTAGGAGRKSEPGNPPLASDSEDDELPWGPALGDAASPRLVPESDAEEPDVRPDVRPPRKRRHAPAPGHHPDVSAPGLEADIRGPKKRRFGPQNAPEPDSGRKIAIANVRPQKRSLDPKKVADPDVKHLEGSNPTLDVGSDAGVRALQKTALFRPNRHRTAPEVSSNPDVQERGPNPDVGDAKNARRMLVVDSDTDVEEVEVLPDVGCPKVRRKDPKMQKKPCVEMEIPNPDVGGPKNGCRTLVDSDTDVEMESSNSAVEGPKNGHQMFMVDSDTDVEEDGANPDVGCPQTHQKTQNIPKSQKIEMGPNDAAVEGSQKGRRVLVVDSDTDVEENGDNPDVGYPKTHQSTQNTPKNQSIEVEARNADVESSQKAHGVLVVDSDTDVEEATSNPDVEHPQGRRRAPRDPEVRTETTNRAAEGWRALLVESDTDVEEDFSNPDVGAPKTHGATQSVPRNPGVERPDPPQKEHWTLVVDSDTDVEENEANPDVGGRKIHRITKNPCKDPDVDVTNPNPDVATLPNECRNLEVDSDTDVEEEDLTQRGFCLKSLRTPQTTQKDPTVVMETPNPDVCGLSRGSVTSNGDSDTDVEDLTAFPNAGAPKPHGTTPEVMDAVAKMAAAPDVDPEGPTRTNDDPDVTVTFPTPGVGAPKAQCPVLNVDSDTDVEDNGVIPDVGAAQGCRGAPGHPDVAVMSPNPDVSSSVSPRSGSDTDVEEVAPTPDVRGLRSRIRTRNRPHPDVGGPTTGSDTGMKEPDPKRWESPPKRRSLSPESPGDASAEGTVPNHQDSAPNPDVEAPNPDVGAQRRDGEPPARGGDPAVPPGVPTPESPRPARNLGVTGDAEATPGRAADATVTESDTEEDPELFLEPTQSFLPPATKGAAPGWDPEEPTQRFFLPKEEEEEEEEEEQPPLEPPRGPLDTRDPPGHLGPQRGSPTNIAPGWDPEEPTQRFFLPKEKEEEEEEEEEEEQPRPEPPQAPPATRSPPGHLGPQRGSPTDAARGWDPEEPTQRFLPREEEEEEEKKKEEEEEEEEQPLLEPPRTPPDAWTSPPGTRTPPEPLSLQRGSTTGAARGWDPEEPTQRFFLPREEDEEEEEEGQPPPQDPPDASVDALVPPVEPVTVTPAPEGTGTGAAPGGEVTEGPRRSRRLAGSRGGGATGGVASGGGGGSGVRGGATAGPAPVRRSPRLQAPPPTPPEPTAVRGRGQVEPRPPGKPRPPAKPHPPRASPAHPQEEEEPPEVTGHQLRPQGGPGSAPPKVLFTGVVASPEMEVALRTLGGSMATSVFDCTHLVTDRVRRTVKFLCAVARGIPIVTPEWLHKSSRSGRVLVPGPFLVRDSQQERHFGFSLAQALRRARRHPLLQGYEVHVTPNVRPEPEHMRDIVTCSGGTFLPTMPHTYAPRRLVISCAADAGCWAPALGARLPLASAELLLTGLLRQRLQLPPFLLPPPDGTPPQRPPTPPPLLQDPPHPPGAAPEPRAAAASPQGVGGGVTTRGRSRRPPLEPPRDPPGTRRRPAAPPTR
ncbi:uncharacterized protein LOC141735107 [Larus michahellis]|uniref:uncharacterized protein LOC141735107 n=1 Tax=Larus michahellis TaxID=119627 RepID=UPI003D9B845B